MRISADLHTIKALKYSVGSFIRQFYKIQLRPGDKLDTLEAKILRSFRKSIDSFPPKELKPFNHDQKALSMLDWIRSSFLDAGTMALYGDQILAIDSEFKEHFLAFDQNSWMFLYRFPKILSGPVDIPKRKVLRALTAYYRLPLEERSEMAPFLEIIEAEQKKISLDHSDMAALAFIMYWAWVFSFILFTLIVDYYLQN